MAVQITIREVPDAVRNQLAARAARRGQSMQQFLAQTLEDIASLPSIEELMEEVERRQALGQEDVPVRSILDALDADRK